MSDAERNQVNNWFDSSAITRLDRQNEGAIIIVMQRVHEDDLVGHVLAHSTDEWKVVDIPARALTPQTYKTGYGDHAYHNVEAGDVLCPALISGNRLTELEGQMGTARFSAQYLQQPVPLDGT